MCDRARGGRAPTSRRSATSTRATLPGPGASNMPARGRASHLSITRARALLLAEPATDRIDDFGRLLRYVVRAGDGLNVNLRLVAIGAGAAWLYEGRRGIYANRLEMLAKRARAR